MTPCGARGACAVVLLLVQPLIVATAFPAPADQRFENEVSRQKAIYESKGEDVPSGYVIDRSLLSYAFTLPAEFSRTLTELQPRHRWLDIGAGEGRAVLDYQTSKYDAMLRSRDGKARAVAMSIEDRRTRQWHEVAATLKPGQIEYLAGRRFREYAPDDLGKFELITDVLGGFSYTRYLSSFVEQALGLLQPGGTLYTLLQDVRSEEGTNRPYYPDARFLTEIVQRDGSELGVCSWLKRITCVEVTCEHKPASTPPIEVYRVRKVCDGVNVPPLELVHFEAGTPPERGFRLVTPRLE